MRIRILGSTLILAFLASLLPFQIFALDYPTREVEFVAAFAPGSNTDSFSRLSARFGEKYLGKPIVVINKPPAVRGFTYLANAKPDGYTIGLISNSVIALPYLVKGANFNYKKNFRVISQIDYSPEGMYVLKGGPFDIPLKEIIKKAKDNPGQIKVGAPGTWIAQDFAKAMFEEQAGVSLKTIPFPGASEAIPALLGGHVDINFGPAAEWAGLLKAGKVAVMAISQDVRNPLYPDIPTFKELGYDVYMLAVHWVGAPAGTPDAVINVLAEVFKKAFAEQAFLDAASNLGSQGAWAGPEESFKAMEQLERVILQAVKKHNLKPK